MKVSVTILLLLLCQLASGQVTPFSARWSFEGSDAGSSSNSLIAVSDVSYAGGVRPLPVNPYTSGYAGLGVNVQYWSTTLCNQTQYVEFTVRPLGTAQLTITSLTFAFSRSASGPQDLSVRSSVDGFSSDIYAQGTSTNYQMASVGLSNPGFSGQTNSITFRIYACNPTASNTVLHLDEIAINGQALPIMLVSFVAKPQGEQVQLSWETTWERNADYFAIQRSPDLGEFVTLGRVTANGNTDRRQHYGFTDQRPLDGVNYYRLRQVDVNGQLADSRPVSVAMNELTPSLELLGNPVDDQRILIAVRNMANAVYTLTILTGQQWPVNVEPRPDGSMLVLPVQPLPAGMYMLRAHSGPKQLVQKIVVR
ncbi:fibronectin type III domain-containing protein [Spirosoma agri]|uniref:T9SS type A sorting domain-containing protein n=1 Tax=Spirosoma agri TaxID=1987381 RepID=A0A6M0IBH3_9BACT|nr:hypothetical protein [Spirosoma agri]NEU65556.1 hypothetical protein [Spirosoma agri]